MGKGGGCVLWGRGRWGKGEGVVMGWNREWK